MLRANSVGGSLGSLIGSPGVLLNCSGRAALPAPPSRTAFARVGVVQRRVQTRPTVKSLSGLTRPGTPDYAPSAVLPCSRTPAETPACWTAGGSRGSAATSADCSGPGFALPQAAHRHTN